MVRRDLAVVGAGHWGRNLVRVFDELGALAAVCDNAPAQFERLSIGDQVARYSDFRTLMRDHDVNAVVIATPAGAHYELCRQALESGRDVFVEKPLALDVTQGQELVELAEQKDLVLMVGHILRYHPAVLRLQELIGAGEIGRIEYVYSNRLNLGRLRTEENTLWSFAPHDISVILALVGERPVAVTSHGEAFLQRDIFDVTLTTIEFPASVKAHTFVSWLHPFKEQRLVVVGSERMAVFEDSSPSEKLALYPHRVQWQRGKVPVAVKGERQVVEVPADEPLRLECEHFLECRATRIPARTDGYEGLLVLEVLSACEQSLRQEGRPVALRAGNGEWRIGNRDNGGRQKAGLRSQKSEIRNQNAELRSQRPVTGAQGFRDGGMKYEGQAESVVVLDALAGRSDELLPSQGLPSGSRRPAVRKAEQPESTAMVHPTAVVDEGAEVGAGTKVWHFSHVSAGARIGRNCVLGQNVFVADSVRVGDGCKVQNNVSLYKGVVLEDGVFCGPSCVFTNVIDPRAFVEKKAEFKPTLVRTGASIGANATVVCGVTLGEYCLVGAGAVVTRNVPDHALVVGVPARQAGWVCRCGERVLFSTGKGSCAKCGAEYVIEKGRRQMSEGRTRKPVESALIGTKSSDQVPMTNSELRVQNSESRGGEALVASSPNQEARCR